MTSITDPTPARPGRFLRLLRDPGTAARVLRGSAFVVLGFGGSQMIRLVSNLILTRLLFPEAFGLMALVTVAIVGLGAFSDMGIGPAIAHSRRGDDPDFLAAAYTLQVTRGFALFLGACALAWPVALFYGEPDLALLLPAVGFSSIITGFNSVAVETAHRHLLLGRVTLIEIASQLIGTVAMVLLAWATRSIWALVIGGTVASVVKLALTHLCLSGGPARFGWETLARRELVRFGRWIFLSTLCGFLLSQGDKLILGKYLSLEALGVYNIGFFLASFPLLLGRALTERMVIPLYREHPPAASAANFARLRRMRAVLTGGDTRHARSDGLRGRLAHRLSLRPALRARRTDRGADRGDTDAAGDRADLRFRGAGGGGVAPLLPADGATRADPDRVSARGRAGVRAGGRARRAGAGLPCHLSADPPPRAALWRLGRGA